MRILTGLFFFIPLFFTSTYAQIQLLNDEFNNTATLSANWLNINDTEQWGAEHLESLDINTSSIGQLHMMPYTSAWFQNWRGTLIYKMVDQDFVITTQVTATDRSGTSIPGAQYSLAGIMLRIPRDYPNGALGAGGWIAGGENYVFLATGFASQSHPSCSGCPGPHFEVKNTINSNSNLSVSSIATSTNVKIRIARIGNAILVLYQLPGQNWVVHERYTRSDFPSEIQVGFVTYTDWNKVNTYTPFFHNSNVLNANLSPDPSSNPAQAFDPALIGTFEYARFDEVTVPAALMGVDLVNTASDADLLSFLGYNCAAFCPNSIHINDAISNGQIAEMQTAISISADNVIDLGADVHYATGSEIDLLPGFEVGSNTQFLAEINGCVSTALTNTDKQ